MPRKRTHLLPRRRMLVLGCLLLVTVAAGWGIGLVAIAPPSAPAASGTPHERIVECTTRTTPQRQDACIATVALDMLAQDGSEGVDQLEAIARADRRLGTRCHLIMHDVAARHARRANVTAVTLAEHLPTNPGVNCPAGLTHGLMIAALEQATPATVAGVVPACTNEPSRIRQINCIHGLGHAFMRNADSDTPKALELCDGLGVRHATDCAPGVFHDYFLGMVGDAGAMMPAGGGEWNPRTLCAGQPARFARACWLRAIQFGRPEDEPIIDLPAEVARQCAGLDRVHRDGCIAAHSFISDGAALDACFTLPRSDATSCLYGMNANPAGEGVLEGCADRPRAVQDLCFSWFGRLHAIFTEDQGDRSFCTSLESRAGRMWCLQGAAGAQLPLGVL